MAPHPHIVTFYGVIEDTALEGATVFEYCSHGNVDAFLGQFNVHSAASSPSCLSILLFPLLRFLLIGRCRQNESMNACGI